MGAVQTGIFLFWEFMAYSSQLIKLSIAAKVASFHSGTIIVTLSHISHLKCVTAAVSTLYVFQSATTWYLSFSFVNNHIFVSLSIGAICLYIILQFCSMVNFNLSH
jgi:hypothetical protein